MRPMTAGRDDRPTLSTGPSGVLQAGFNLSEALEGADLFLVATLPVAPSPAGGEVFPPTLQIGNWRFALNIGKCSEPARVGNVLIIKQTTSVPLVDALATPQNWWRPGTTLRDGASGEVGALSRSLVEYVTAAITRSEDDLLYRPFAVRVTDRAWCGALILNVSLDPSPVEGVEYDIFCAHHLGWELDRVAGQTQLCRPAATFGLIDYEVDAEVPGAPSHRLAVVFENAAVKSFDLRG